ncbi:MAG: DUF3326 domain-containing protein [Bryobacterales bacterium]|nr:DUF3326 domain-containing protein [Bryobacterales bacterium]
MEESKLLLRESEIELGISLERPFLLEEVRSEIGRRLDPSSIPLRFAVTQSTPNSLRCSVSVMEGVPRELGTSVETIFRFSKRQFERTGRFNVVLNIPTGIGAEIGGHAGDAGSVAHLLSQTCDTLILHPNVVNASDINEMPSNSLYVEGSVLSRLLMGTIGLATTRQNRVLVVIDDHDDELFANAAVNAVSAARSSYGFSCQKVVKLRPPIKMWTEYTSVGVAAGKTTGLGRLFAVLEEHWGKYDAVALSSVIRVPHSFHQGYFDAMGEMVNPWGGVEAMVTHAVSSIYNVQSAHSPMFESQEIANLDPGVVDVRMAAEAVSVTFLPSVLKGLHRSPRILASESGNWGGDVISAVDVSCLVIPDGCLGLPTLAAVEQGIPTIAVRENRNLMKNDLSKLAWRDGQFFRVNNYWEAAGVLCAVRAGISPESVRRPMGPTQTENQTFRGRDDKDRSSGESERSATLSDKQLSRTA